jgi:hypothetical protein
MKNNPKFRIYGRGLSKMAYSHHNNCMSIPDEYYFGEARR